MFTKLNYNVVSRKGLMMGNVQSSWRTRHAVKHCVSSKHLAKGNLHEKRTTPFQLSGMQHDWICLWVCIHHAMYHLKAWLVFDFPLNDTLFVMIALHEMCAGRLNYVECQN